MSDFEFIFSLSKIFNSIPARWAVTPDLFMQVDAYVKDHIVGAGINYRVIIPRLEARKNLAVYKENSQLGSIVPFAFIALNFDSFKMRSRLSYVQSGGTFDIMGEPFVLFRNPKTDERFWANSGAIAFWADFIYSGHKIVELGLFTGITKNVGSPDTIQKGYETELGECRSLIVDYRPLGLNVADYMFSLAPRIRLKFGNFTVAGEIEYSRASFAKSAKYSTDTTSWSIDSSNSQWLCDFDCKGKVINSCPVSNFRLFVSTSYEFA